jgi:DNA modification methylase
VTPYVDDQDFTLHVGDVRDVLPQLPAESIDCALTSPPFYALRDYGVDGQIGLEASPEEWAAELVGVFREVRRVLKPRGTLWVECGDSYGNNYRGSQRPYESDEHQPQAWNGPARLPQRREHPTKPKDLLGQPWLLAFALRADGWYLRQAIIWHKSNAMPESAKDRCTTAHSYVFLLSKHSRYHFDTEAIAEPAEWARWGDQTVPKYEGTQTSTGWMQPKTKVELMAKARHTSSNFLDRRNESPTDVRKYVNSGNRSTNGKERTEEMRGFDNRLDRADGLKNPRSVWSIPTEGFPEAHFATWPQALVERIIKAGCPEGGTVLDPFMGSGTTALVARRLGRKAVGVELNEEYAAMAARRLGQQSLLAL